MRVRAWEEPWVRVIATSHGPRRHLRLTAGMVLDYGDGKWEPALLLADPGTRSVESYRSVLIGLMALRQRHAHASEPVLVLVLLQSADQPARKQAWLDLMRRAATHLGEEPLALRVVLSTPERSYLSRRDWRWTRGSVADSVLHLHARHPLLTLRQLVHVLGYRPSRVKGAQAQLIECGWLRRLELPHSESTGDLECLVALTPAGRREAARRVSLRPEQARRNQGLLASDSTSTNHQWIRHIAHTVGVNDVFAELSRLARRARAHGGDDALLESRSAAACQRGRFRPDGYGCYQHDGARYGFFLEYDRGTERRGDYAAKLATYYRARDSGAAARDFVTFPTLLVVTTSARAEELFADEAGLAAARHGTSAIPVLLTSVARASQDQWSFLGPVWRCPGPIGSVPRRQVWIPT